MSLKSRALSLIDTRWIGIPLRAVGGFTRTRPRIAGLINPFYVPATVVNNNDAHYIAFPGSYLAEAAGLNGALRFPPDAYEPEISFLISKLIRNTDIVLDIGANVGLHTVSFAQAASSGHVYAFEPVVEMAERLSQNCALNRVENVTLVPCALGSQDETLDMAVNIAGAGLEGTSSLAGSFHVEDNPQNYETRAVPVRRLDDVVEALGVSGRIAFIKIDTEGFETYVLEGGTQTLKTHQPAMIVEAHSRRLEKAWRSFAWYLENFADYHIFIVSAVGRANPYLRLEPLTAVQPEIAVNLLFLPRTATFDCA